MAKKKLGKGLGAIISTSPTPVEDMETGLVEEAAADKIIELDIESIIPNPDQPRTHFDETEIKGLAESIKAVGLIQPIIIRKVDDTHVVVAGERRLRASKEAGLKTIKTILIEANEEDNLTLALIENIQRANLDPIEEAKAYKALVSRFKLKQQDIAHRVGKDRATIANSLRLLNLPENLQEALSEGKISVGHAKVLLSVSNPEKQLEIFNFIIEEGLSVRALEKLLNGEKENSDENENSSSPEKKEQAKKSPHIKKMEDKLVSKLGTKVEIRHATNNKGKIEISYYSLDDFERIVELFK
ncbi:MAG: ParB/RepB/Spo0J family partition protein [bacterium]|nr:ParB/RepB/Spo0J family partition protein [bacterium]